MASVLPIPDLPAARLPEEDLLAQAFTWFGSGLDAALLAGMQIVVDAALMPDHDALPALRASAEALLAPELEAEPARYFAFAPGDLALRPVHERVRRELDGGAALSLRFASAYRPYHPGSAAVPADDLVHMELWRHETERRRATVVALHGFTMGRPRLDAPVLLASHWWRAGLDVALLTLPFHGARTPADARFSGEHFAVPHVARMAESVRRAVHEVRAVSLWLRETSGAPVGLLGLSLGGYLAALAAGLWDDFAFVVPMVPPVCIGDLAWQFFRRSRRQGAAQPAFAYEELRRHYRVHSPLAHPLRTPRERTFIVAGRGDRIVPPEHPFALWCHWGRPGIHWYSGGHLTPFGRGEMAAAVLRHLAGLDLVQG
jgi:hypothetical protein